MAHLGECCEHGDGACVGAADGAVGVEQAQRQDARVQVRLPHTGSIRPCLAYLGCYMRAATAIGQCLLSKEERGCFRVQGVGY